ncbi:hypothetical protein OIU76_006597 [Salix suchowensis]|nr:hypothetical protein OIU76_006597 [Salix suchowensis]
MQRRRRRRRHIQNIKRKNALVHSYNHGISGFAARLAAPEAQPIAKKHGVLSVFPDPVHHPHTTRSWDFLKYETDLEINLSPNSDWNLFSQGSDTIVGSLDSGIWPESESFNARDMSPIPSRWKVNGSRSYIDPDDIADGLPNTPSDTMGHGTDVASTASGTMVPGGSYYGLAIRAFHAVENGITVGEAINFDNVGKSPVHQLISAMSAKNTYAGETRLRMQFFFRNCNPDSMVGDMIKEKIVICENDDDKHSQYVKKEEVQSLGGIGIVLVDNKTRGFADNFMEFPMTVTSSKDAAEPDIAAPGADMVAAWKSNDTEVTLRGTESPHFHVISGTSCHVHMFLKWFLWSNPSWSPSAIKSAMLTRGEKICSNQHRIAIISIIPH